MSEMYTLLLRAYAATPPILTAIFLAMAAVARAAVILLQKRDLGEWLRVIPWVYIGGLYVALQLTLPHGYGVAWFPPLLRLGLTFASVVEMAHIIQQHRQYKHLLHTLKRDGRE